MGKTRKTNWERFFRETSVGAGNTLLKFFHKPHRIKRKPNEGIVTEADKASENYVLRKISREFPSSSIITEESGEYAGDRSLCWIIDPLDGTTNFAHGFPWFCVSIAVYEDGEALAGAVYEPLRRELFFAERGKGTRLNGKRVQVSHGSKLADALVTTGFYYTSRGKSLRRDMAIFERVNRSVLGLRRPGAAALDLATVACGRADGFWQRGLAPWDVAAGSLLVREAGGRVSDFKGGRFAVDAREIVATNGALHSRMMSLISSGR